mmetsp:Transcript_11059/g.32263  ORF Transcript_11059/g.32263 Transcript_11059/m.32263 type:complete len:202 (-) Transcript_11059:5396-6001(-)|eukprot:scaffold113774_cov32-Tisochrysis_lutea.AAC.3
MSAWGCHAPGARCGTKARYTTIERWGITGFGPVGFDVPWHIAVCAQLAMRLWHLWFESVRISESTRATRSLEPRSSYGSNLCIGRAPLQPCIRASSTVLRGSSAPVGPPNGEHASVDSPTMSVLLAATSRERSRAASQRTCWLAAAVLEIHAQWSTSASKSAKGGGAGRAAAPPSASGKRLAVWSARPGALVGLEQKSGEA